MKQLTEEQRVTMAYVYQEVCREYKRIKRMRSEPFTVLRLIVLASMKNHLRIMRSIFDSLDIEAAFREVD